MSEAGGMQLECVWESLLGLLFNIHLWGVRPLVEFYLEPVPFSGGCNWGVSALSCFDFILGVTFEEVPGHRDLP